jgi:hypothetical protein
MTATVPRPPHPSSPPLSVNQPHPLPTALPFAKRNKLCLSLTSSIAMSDAPPAFPAKICDLGSWAPLSPGPPSKVPDLGARPVSQQTGAGRPSPEGGQPGVTTGEHMHTRRASSEKHAPLRRLRFRGRPRPAASPGAHPSTGRSTPPEEIDSTPRRPPVDRAVDAGVDAVWTGVDANSTPRWRPGARSADYTCPLRAKAQVRVVLPVTQDAGGSVESARPFGGLARVERPGPTEGGYVQSVRNCPRQSRTPHALRRGFARFCLTGRALHACNSTGEVLRRVPGCPGGHHQDDAPFAWGVAPACRRTARRQVWRAAS